MTIFDSIKSKNIDEFAEWLDKYGAFDNSPWIEWFNLNYCNECDAEIGYYSNDEKKKHPIQFSWCELNNKCKFFKHIEDIPNNKQTIKMWLESEY